MTETAKTYTQVYKQQLAELDDENKKLTKAHQELLSQNESLSAQNQELLSQNDDLQRENEALSSQNAALEVEKCRTEAELEKWSGPRARLSERIDAMTLILSSFQRNSELIWFEEGGESSEAKREKEALQQIADRLDEAADPSLVTRVVFFFVAFVADIYAFAVSHCLALLRRFYQQREDACRKDLEEQYERRRQALEHEQEEVRQDLERKQKEAWRAMEQAAAENEAALTRKYQQEMDGFRLSVEQERVCLTNELNTARADLCGTQRTLSALEKQMAQLKAEHASLAGQKARLESSVAQKDRELSDLRSASARMEAERKRLDTLVQNKTQAIAELESRVQSLEAGLREKDSAVSRLNSQIDSLNKKLESANKTLAERDGQIKKLQGELSSARTLSWWLIFACLVLGFVVFGVAAG